jgi:hypothetical protein
MNIDRGEASGLKGRDAGKIDRIAFIKPERAVDASGEPKREGEGKQEQGKGATERGARRQRA